MNINTAIKYVQKGNCACKHVGRVLDKLLEVVATGVRNVDVTFGQHSVVLDIGEGREVLCSRFFEQRD